MANQDAQSQTAGGADRPGALGPLPPNGRRVFLADLHLDGSDSAAALTFRAVLKGLAANVAETPTHLYILGDLFEFWEEVHPQIAARYENDLKAMEEAARIYPDQEGLELCDTAYSTLVGCDALVINHFRPLIM